MRRLIIVMTALSMAAAAPALAQRRDKREEIRERIKAIRVARLVEALNLDERTTTRLMPIIDKGYDDIALIGRDSGQARRDLSFIIESGRGDDGRVNQLIDRLVANRARIMRLEEDMLRQARRILTPTQVAKLVLLLPEVNRNLERRIRRAAQGAQGTPPRSGEDDDRQEE